MKERNPYEPPEHQEPAKPSKAATIGCLLSCLATYSAITAIFSGYLTIFNLAIVIICPIIALALAPAAYRYIKERNNDQ